MLLWLTTGHYSRYWIEKVNRGNFRVFHGNKNGNNWCKTVCATFDHKWKHFLVPWTIFIHLWSILLSFISPGFTKVPFTNWAIWTSKTFPSVLLGFYLSRVRDYIYSISSRFQDVSALLVFLVCLLIILTKVIGKGKAPAYNKSLFTFWIFFLSCIYTMFLFDLPGLHLHEE